MHKKHSLGTMADLRERVPKHSGAASHDDYDADTGGGDDDTNVEDKSTKVSAVLNKKHIVFERDMRVNLVMVSD